jgi:hypothetical protein
VPACESETRKKGGLPFGCASLSVKNSSQENYIGKEADVGSEQLEKLPLPFARMV